jgi:hypothetical protein
MANLSLSTGPAIPAREVPRGDIRPGGVIAGGEGRAD